MFIFSAYNPADYQAISAAAGMEDLFQYITMYVAYAFL